MKLLFFVGIIFAWTFDETSHLLTLLFLRLSAYGVPSP